MKLTAKKIIKPIFTAASLLSTAVLTLAYLFGNHLPDHFQVVEGGSLTFQHMPVRAVYNDSALSQAELGDTALAGSEYSVDLKLFGIIPVKEAQVDVVGEMYVVPSGTTFGIKILTEGVLVVGMSDVDGQEGLSNPAKNAGIKEGDIILSIDGQTVSSNEDVAAVIEKSEGRSLRMELQRDNMTFTVAFTPVLSATENKYKAGLWVRDSSAGIGTLTFYDPATGIAAGLGHGICDVDTGDLLPLSSGELVGAKIHNVVKGKVGSPGELRGQFTDGTLGNLLMNGETGVYGRTADLSTGGQWMKIAMKQEVETGPAQILTTIDDGEPRLYDCEIEKVHFNDESLTQNMVIRVTDPELLETTGGIVQGMSGSPIIQNDCLVGAVTHVFVNDPTKGYGIFAENMYNSAKSVAGASAKKAS